jgi:hypothetical protein
MGKVALEIVPPPGRPSPGRAVSAKISHWSDVDLSEPWARLLIKGALYSF